MKEHKRLWLIDASYLFNAQRSVCEGYNFDYKKLRERLEQDGKIWRAYYLNSSMHPTSEENNFHNWLRSAPPRGPKIITQLYQLKTTSAERAYCENCDTKVTLTCPSCRGYNLRNQQQKGVDVGIVTLALTLAKDYDTLILSSGDGDLLDSVEYLSDQGKRFELAVFNNGVSTELQARADHIYWIDDFKDEVRR